MLFFDDGDGLMLYMKKFSPTTTTTTSCKIATPLLFLSFLVGTLPPPPQKKDKPIHPSIHLPEQHKQLLFQDPPNSKVLPPTHPTNKKQKPPFLLPQKTTTMEGHDFGIGFASGFAAGMVITALVARFWGLVVMNLLWVLAAISNRCTGGK